MTDELARDATVHALRPSDASMIDGMCSAVFTSEHDNPGSNRKLESNMKLWRAYCSELGTPAWRPDVRTLSETELKREKLLATYFISWTLARMRGRTGAGSRAKPKSAYDVYLGVRKAHEKAMIEMVSCKAVHRQVIRESRRHIEAYGAGSLVPRRKLPFTKQIWQHLLSATGKRGPLDLDNPRVRLAFRAFAATLKETGLRKSEASVDRAGVLRAANG